MGKFVCIGVFYFGIYILCAEASQNKNSSLYRLPKSIVPEHYDILLYTNITRGNYSYKGVVTLNLSVIAETNQVKLHSQYLDIIDKEMVFLRVLSNGTLERIVANSQYHEDETQFYIISFNDNLTPGKYLLKMHFIGEVRDDFFGFYRSSYRTKNKKRWIAVTQFSPVYARRAFPCMDEPGFKATFQLRIGHYQNETVSSNTNEESREIAGELDYYITTFSRTPRMSTYLLGWAIHDFHRINSSDSRLWLWTRLDDSNLSWSLTSSPGIVDGPKIYSALQDWMGLKNPLQKIEQIAVPDFKFSAMENWGLITYRESSMNVHMNDTPLQHLPRILVTIAHEYAHTWFGNIVTPEFWSYPWLKEGFATYFSYLILSTIHEDWNYMNMFSMQVTQNCLFDDSKDHNKLMNKIDVGSSKSAESSLDFITYNKAAAVIRMISEVMGEKLFKDAIRSYLEGKQLDTATPPDLYKYLELTFNSSARANSVPVSLGEVIESWANQLHYPLVRGVHVSPKRLRVTQELFQGNYSKPNGQVAQFWWIPLNILVPANDNSSNFIKITKWLGPEKSIEFDLPENAMENSWFLLNPSQIGYYRSEYSQKNLELLLKLLKSDNYWHLAPIDRATLLNDAFNLAKDEYKEYSEVFKLYEYLDRETDYEPWVTASTAFSYLYFKLRNKFDVRMAFRRFAIDLLTPIYKKLSFEEKPSETHLKKVQRNLILGTACDLDLEDCILKAKSIFNDWIADENKHVPVNLKNFVYCVGIEHSNNDDLIKFWEKFLTTNYYTEKSIMMNALTCSSNSTFIYKYLDFSINPDSDVAKQDRLPIIRGIVGRTSKNIEITLNYIEENFAKIIAFRGVSFLEEIFSTIGEKITSDEEESKLKSFINRNGDKLADSLKAAERAVKSARGAIDQINRSASKLAAYLNVTSAA